MRVPFPLWFGFVVPFGLLLLFTSMLCLQQTNNPRNTRSNHSQAELTTDITENRVHSYNNTIIIIIILFLMNILVYHV